MNQPRLRDQITSYNSKVIRSDVEMFLGLKIFVTAVLLYAGVRLAGIGIGWLKEFFDQLTPRRNRHYYDD